MPVRQYYYTSYVDQATGSAGFQVKALSPDISAEVQEMLPRLIAYRIPPSCDERALSTHPVALRYLYCGPHECILLNSQSCGCDELGRPGNFFAHALLLAPADFQHVPPVCFWGSPFWRASDPEERSDLVSLPILPTFDVLPSLDEAQIWSFLEQGERRMLLFKLLCAVVHGVNTQRRIVILDSSEHVVLWIAAVSRLLPPAYRPLLSFATYHHDPYQAHYLITGTTEDSSFRASPSDHQSYFILDALTGTTSDVTPSLYADMVIEFANVGQYASRLLPIFQTSAQQFPPSATIDEQLDRLALSVQAQHRPSMHILTPLELSEATRATIESMLTLSGRQLTQEQINVVQHALADLSREDYQRVIERYLPAMLQSEIDAQSHLRLLQTFFPRAQQLTISTHFWHIYLQALADLLQQSSTIDKGIALLDFWFTISPQDVGSGYPVQQYFLCLSSTLSQLFEQLATKKKVRHELLQSLYTAASTRPWYPALRPLLPQIVSSSSLSGLSIVSLWQRKPRNEIFSKEKQAWQSSVEQLFTGADIVEQHQHCADLYRAVSVEQFWSCYWKACKQYLFISQEAERVPCILAWLSFWFDSAFDLLGTTPYLPQEFFLGLKRVLEEVVRDQPGRETLHQVHEAVSQNEKKACYQWYPLVAHYFSGR